jgi:hypothetical protein
MSNPNTTSGKFQKGKSGNPSGRPPGTRNRATLLAEQLLDSETEPLIRKVVDLANKGNIQALRFCLERVLPVRKERTIELDLPPAQNAQDLAGNLQRIVAAVGEGRITPGEAQALNDILKSQERAIELVGMEHRLQVLEDRISDVHASEDRLRKFIERTTNENAPTA